MYIKINVMNKTIRVCEPILFSELGVVSLLLIFIQLRDGKFHNCSITASNMQFPSLIILLSCCECRCNWYIVMNCVLKWSKTI